MQKVLERSTCDTHRACEERQRESGEQCTLGMQKVFERSTCDREREREKRESERAFEEGHREDI